TFSTDPRRMRPRVRLTGLRIEDADDHPPDGRIEGTVTCEFEDGPVAGDHLRLTHHRPTGPRVMFLHHPKPMPPAGRMVMRFSANPLEPRAKKNERLVPVFVDWVSRSGVVESDALAALVLLRER
ncbi:MAG: hypothetical protein J0I06_09740, partial [Planctomycetes bacterium]|nr:hypothetical protein [Planctomycetota bacterium]